MHQFRESRKMKARISSNESCAPDLVLRTRSNLVKVDPLIRTYLKVEFRGGWSLVLQS